MWCLEQQNHRCLAEKRTKQCEDGAERFLAQSVETRVKPNVQRGGAYVDPEASMWAELTLRFALF